MMAVKQHIGKFESDFARRLAYVPKHGFVNLMADVVKRPSSASPFCPHCPGPCSDIDPVAILNGDG